MFSMIICANTFLLIHATLVCPPSCLGGYGRVIYIRSTFGMVVHGGIFMYLLRLTKEE